MNELKVEWASPYGLYSEKEGSLREIPVVRLAQVDEVIAEVVIQADLFLRTMTRCGQWDDGCFYYNGRSASELEGHIRDCQALLDSRLVAEWRTRQEPS